MKKTYEDESVTIYEDKNQTKNIYKYSDTINTMMPRLYSESFSKTPIKVDSVPEITDPIL
jgi:hypothetical protein